MVRRLNLLLYRLPMKRNLCLPKLFAGFTFAAVAALWLSAIPVRAALIAYEDFNYPADSDLSSQAGGTGWAAAWSAGTIGDSNVLGSLNYTDSFGNQLVTSGNHAHMTGSYGNNSTPARNLPSPLGADGTTVWFSFVGYRTGVDTLRPGNFQIRTNSDERLAVGKGTVDVAAPPTWSLLDSGNAGNSVFSTYPMDVPSFCVLRIDYVAGNDNAYLFVNPRLDQEPDISLAAAQKIGPLDMQFNNVRMYAGNTNANGVPANYAEFDIDEIRIGTTYTDVTPFVPGTGGGALRWSGSSIVGSDLQLQLTGAPGSNYTVEATVSLAPPRMWTSVGNGTLDGAGKAVFVDSNAPTLQPVRFYRAVQ